MTPAKKEADEPILIGGVNVRFRDADWLDRIKAKFEKEWAIGMDTGDWDEFFQEIRKGHEAAMDDLVDDVQTDVDKMHADLAISQAARTAWESKANELLKERGDYCMSCDRQARISDLIRQLESKCKECVDLRLDLEFRKKRQGARRAQR